jgi:hypothetical protein
MTATTTSSSINVKPLRFPPKTETALFPGALCDNMFEFDVFTFTCSHSLALGQDRKAQKPITVLYVIPTHLATHSIKSESVTE